MTGDKHKPESLFSRWMDAFADGLKSYWKGRTKTPSNVRKEFNRKWNRRKIKKEVKADLRNEIV